MATVLEYIKRKSRKIANRVRVDTTDFFSRWRTNVLFSEFYQPGTRERALCVFAHYSDENIIHDYVVYMVREYKKAGCDVLFVSACGEGFSILEFKKLDGLVVGAVLRANFGYDFGSWKTAYDLYQEMTENYKAIIFANDSVYGPFSDLKPLISRVIDSELDIWSLTDSYERNYHYQSYFWGVGSNLARSAFFKEFWEKRFSYTSDRDKAIRLYELTLENWFVQERGMNGGVLYPLENLVEGQGGTLPLTRVNPMHHYGFLLLREFDFPFVKRELILSNLKGVRDVSDVLDIMRVKNEKVFSMSLEHLKSVGFEVAETK